MSRDPKKQTPPSDEFDQEFHTSEEEGILDPNLMGELWDDEPSSVSPDEPEPEAEEPEEEYEDDEEEEEGEEPEAEEEEVEEPAEGEPITYKVKDKEYDLDTLVKEGLLDDLITQASQQAHFQRLYEEQRQLNELALKQQQQFQQQYQQQRPQQPPMSVEQLKAQVAPHIARAVQEGFLEDDFVEMYPNAAASQMLVYNDYAQIKQVVMGMYQHFMRTAAQQQYETARSNFTAACNSLANKHDVYKPLADQGEQEEFFKFLAERVNPEVNAINDEFLARQYLGYKQESILETVRDGKTKSRKKKKKKRKLAAGEGGSPRKGGRRGSDQTLDEVVIEGLMQQFTE